MKVAIFEDEKNNAERLAQLLVQSSIHIESLEFISSVEEGKQWMKEKNDADLIFMDIQLSDGICFEIFQDHICEIPIIFTTAYDNYAIQAFKLFSIDYLLKPLDPEVLKAALQKFQRINSYEFQQAQIAKIAEQYFKREEKRFIGKINNQLLYVKAKNIALVQITDGIVWAYTFNGQRTPLDNTLDQIEKQLDRALFFRINRKMIVHIDAIERITSYHNSRLILKLNTETPESDHIVSREKVSEFKDWLQGNHS